MNSNINIIFFNNHNLTIFFELWLLLGYDYDDYVSEYIYIQEDLILFLFSLNLTGKIFYLLCSVMALQCNNFFFG